MIEKINVAGTAFDIFPDARIETRTPPPGPPERIDGYTLAIIEMDRDAPHGGEVHPDGDEILIVLEGRIAVTGDNQPEKAVELGPGEACIVPRGEWHRVHLLERARLLHLTPGPHGDHRPL